MLEEQEDTDSSSFGFVVPRRKQRRVLRFFYQLKMKKLVSEKNIQQFKKNGSNRNETIKVLRILQVHSGQKPI